ncbi:CPBP family intramembrane glutamic endopeptidase [Frateuria defendens]|uniref:CPBP family intramembrane glutamic endopeptidase n=1 Tax=Frateuria defendens TaxID=2219559 RepID=UPI00066FDEBA|nr:type II CAAX endopeptidase family protein [Frateuria defendens]
MDRHALAFLTPTDAPRWKRWLVYSPLARIVIFAVLLALASTLASLVLRDLGWLAKGTTPLQRGLAEFLARAAPALAAYLLLVRWVERRRPSELSLRALAPYGLAGLAAGTVLFSAIVGALWLAGSYHVVGTNPHANWLPALLMVGLGAGIGEEIICRGVLFRIVEEGLGTWVALGVSALFFGGAHLANPGATLWSSAAIAIEAGILFGLLYHVTRSLWLCMGLHTAWNFMQGTVYGIPVSGTRADGWLVSTRSGPDWLSGGVFGAEASVVALGLCLLVSAGLLAQALRRRLPVPPLPRRALAAAPLPPSLPDR